MPRQSVQIVFLLLACVCHAQHVSWRTEHRDSLLVPSNAMQVQYTEWWNGGVDQLTYVVNEPYPAADLTAFICEDLRSRGWRNKSGCSGSEVWQKGKYLPEENRNWSYTWQATFNDAGNNQTVYLLEYNHTRGSNYMRTLHVDVQYSPYQPPPAQVPATPEKAGFFAGTNQRLLRLFLLFLYFFVLITVPVSIALTPARTAVFYFGPHAWLTWINLGFFAPMILLFLSIGAGLIAAVFQIEGLLIAPIGAALVVFGLGHIGYFVLPALFALLGGIFFTNSIPRNVRFTHLALGGAALCFLAICIHFGGGINQPLMQW